MLRRFQLVRFEDESGVSGTGVVAHGAAFACGKAVLCWAAQYHTVGVYDSVDELVAIHGHGGRTVLEWIDA